MVDADGRLLQQHGKRAQRGTGKLLVRQAQASPGRLTANGVGPLALVAPEAFRPAFEACEALLRFAVENRPSGPLTDDAAGRLIFRTYARSSKTYNASFLLSGEVTVCRPGCSTAPSTRTWLWPTGSLNPVDAPEKYERNRRHLIEQMRGALAKHGAGVEMEDLPELTDGDRKAYAQEFGNRSWTGLSINELTKEVEDEWPEGKFGRDMLWWIYDIAQRFHNFMLHHTPHSLGLTSVEENNDRVVLDVGPSTAHVQGALLGAFYCYQQAMSLVLDEEQEKQLQAVSDEYFPPAFLAIRTERGDGDQT